MAKKITDLTELASIEDDDLLVVEEDSSGITKKCKYSTLETALETALLLGATPTEVAVTCDGNTATAAEITAVCDGNTATAAEITKAADGIGVTIPRVKVLEIGDWNMDVTPSVSILHGLTFSNIVGAVAYVRRDDAGAMSSIHMNNGLGAGLGASVYISSGAPTYISISREASGFFDGINFDSTSFNRGWIHIYYID